jgi:hypothetical protein
MKLSSGKLQFCELKSPMLMPEHFVPHPCWYFTFLHAINVREEGLIYFVLSCMVTVV